MRRGLTIVEVLVVTAIVGILVGTVTVLASPAMKLKGYETRIRSDMRQIVGAINLYTTDNDGHYPVDKRLLSQKLPWRFPELDAMNGESPYGPYQGTASYYYTYPWPVQWKERRYDFPEKFDPATEPILVAHFLPRRFGQYRNEFHWVGTKKGRHHTRVEDWRHLMARLDGSVRWLPATNWQNIARGHGHLPYPLSDKPMRPRRQLP